LHYDHTTQTETVRIDEINVADRVRVSMGDIDKLCDSIKEFGLIEPVILAFETDDAGVNSVPILVAGGRRLAAVKRLGWKELVHGKHYLWSDEKNDIRLKAMEIEENIRREGLTWQEEIRGKQQLLDIMQRIHGVPSAGRPGAFDKPGFGVNKLASMLGESVGAISQDLQVARALKELPSLARAETKGSALSQLRILSTVGTMMQSGQSKTASAAASPLTAKPRFWELWEMDFRSQTPENNVPDSSVDLIWTDLPYGSDVDKTHSTEDSSFGFDDGLIAVHEMLIDVARESYRVLKPDRYAVFCFGFRTYGRLCEELENTGFHVNPVPFIWCKPTKFGVNPNVAYCISYEPLLVAWKGKPCLIRPGGSNVIHLPPPAQDGKLHLVQKPVELVERFLLDMTGEHATVVDWCAGTGTTGVAAQNLKRHAILFERDPSMALLARTRLESL
jgi:DNA modification methylase